MRNNRGTTIIEIIIYFGLLSIFLTSIVGIFTSSLNLKLENESTSAIFQDEKYIYSKLNYEVVSTNSIENIKNNLDLVDGKLLLNGISLNGLDTQISNLVIQEVGNLNGKPTVSVNFDIASQIDEGGINRTKHFQTTYGTR